MSENDWERPSIYLQWHNSEVCFDFHCICDREDEPAGVSHFDGTSKYVVRCARCGRTYQLPAEIRLELVEGSNEEVTELRPDDESD